MTKAIILQMAGMISERHAGVLSEMEACIRDTARYYKEHSQQYEERGITAPANTQEEQGLWWITMADCLTASSVAAELDWKCELEDFLFAVGNLAGVRKNGLPVEGNWFDEADSIEEWCGILNGKWESFDFCLAQMDIDSDSYVIFPVSLLALAPLTEAAKLTGERFEKAGGGTETDRNRTHEFFLNQEKELETAENESTSEKCEICAAAGKQPGKRPCQRNQYQCFQINLKPQELTKDQLQTVGNCFRLNPSVIGLRIAEGRTVYVKNILKETLEAMRELDLAAVSYEVIPFAPNYNLYHSCTEKKPGGGSELFIARFDKERGEDFKLK